MATGSANPQESTETPEMPSRARSDQESSNTVVSPPGPSREIGDQMNVPLTSRVSPGSVPPEATTNDQNSCLEYCNTLGGCCNYGCAYGWITCIFAFCTYLQKNPFKLFFRLVFSGAALFIIGFLISKMLESGSYGEVIYAALLVIYCYPISFFKRGHYSKSCRCTCPKRNEGDGNPSVMAHGQESTRETVSSESRMDVPEQPHAVQLNFDGDPATSAIEQGECIPWIDDNSSA